MTNSEQLTPLLRQYHDIKRGHKDAILFFRMGDFYEMFYEDAVTASKILEIALTTRDKRNNDPVPMCGIPYHAADSYLPKLIKEGYKVAICEQVEDPTVAKGLVRRKVIRIITPGTVLDGNLLESKENNFVASIYPAEKATGLAFVDISTGDFYVAEIITENPICHPELSCHPELVSGSQTLEMLKPLNLFQEPALNLFQGQHDREAGFSDKIADEIARIEPRELIVPQGSDISKFIRTNRHHRICINPYPAEMFEYNRASSIFHEHIKGNTSELSGACPDPESSSGVSEMDSKGPSINAAGALLSYLSETQKSSLRNINSVKVYRGEQYMTLDESAQRTLELVRSSQTGQKKGTLFHLLDKSVTPMGGRLLRHWILHPLMDANGITKRQDAVEELKTNYTLRCRLRDSLRNVHDMERIISRITLRAANGRDLVSLNQCLSAIPEIKGLLTGCSDHLIKGANNMMDSADNLRGLIDRAIADSPPLSVTDGGIIKDGFNPELDELRQISREGKGWIARLEAKERQRSGIDSLKVRYNRVFGYYIEVTKANLRNVPQDYIRKQTLVGAERFITPELKEYEDKVLGADEKIKRLEHQLFEEIREAAAAEVETIQKSAKGIALTDVIASLSEAAHTYHYVRPSVDSTLAVRIKDGRHPVIERMDLGERFVPNDTEMDCDNNRLMILTGPNMAGKSTYMRQVALIVLMAQTGSFVPAGEVYIGMVDRIFTRIGASDNIAEGRSTFMVEMEESANILRNATHRSLILLDEIGRGTSTFDGISIAWASAEYINRRLKAKTLFATHYHELTELALTTEGIFNAHMVVREWNDEVIFLRKVMPGMADKSYGIQVARLAGIPPEIIGRAKEVLANLEKEELDDIGMPKLAHTDKEEHQEAQIDIFSHGHEIHPVLAELRELNIMSMTPLQAIAKLDELKKKTHEPRLTKEDENQISKIKNQNDNAKFKKDKDNA